MKPVSKTLISLGQEVLIVLCNAYDVLQTPRSFIVNTWRRSYVTSANEYLTTVQSCKSFLQECIFIVHLFRARESTWSSADKIFRLDNTCTLNVLSKTECPLHTHDPCADFFAQHVDLIFTGMNSSPMFKNHMSFITYNMTSKLADFSIGSCCNKISIFFMLLPREYHTYQ